MRFRLPNALLATGLLLSSAIVALGGCAPSPLHLDPLNTSGRDGGGPPLTYPALMRIGDAAYHAGDFANAVNLYRRAAQLAPRDPAPFVALAAALLRMDKVDEAILADNSALARDPQNLPALQGLAKAYLLTGRPELALAPLDKALARQPNDPKLLLLLALTKDQVGQYGQAQAIYRQAQQLAPDDPAVAVDLALSLALSGDYETAIAELRPLAMAPFGTAAERQTLSLLYGLAGDREEAARLGRIDLDAAAVAHNLAYIDTLRLLSPQARARALLSLGRGGAGGAS
jgi:Flp pilus assembly protein TadD